MSSQATCPFSGAARNSAASGVHANASAATAPGAMWRRKSNCRDQSLENSACRRCYSANISTTQVYTRLDYQHLAKAYDAAHPRARRKQA